MLRALPSVFSLGDVEIMFDMPTTDAVKAISRWKEKGYAAALGPRTGVFYNRFLSPHHDDRRLALDKILRLPYAVIGINALRHGQWVTQRGGVLEIAAPVTAGIQTHPKVNGVVFCPRPAGWFDKVNGQVCEAEDGVYGLPTLSPAYALADILLSKAGLTRKDNKVWDADPDDILPEVDEPEDVIIQCREAAIALGVPLDRARDFLSQVPHLADCINVFDGASVPSI